MNEPFALLQRVSTRVEIISRERWIDAGTTGSIMDFLGKDALGQRWYLVHFDGVPDDGWPMRECELVPSGEPPLSRIGGAE